MTKPAVLPVDHHLAHAGGVQADHRHAGGHRLGDDHALGLALRCEGEDVHGVVGIDQVLPGQRARERSAVRPIPRRWKRAPHRVHRRPPCRQSERGCPAGRPRSAGSRRPSSPGSFPAPAAPDGRRRRRSRARPQRRRAPPAIAVGEGSHVDPRRTTSIGAVTPRPRIVCATLSDGANTMSQRLA